MGLADRLLGDGRDVRFDQRIELGRDADLRHQVPHRLDELLGLVSIGRALTSDHIRQSRQPALACLLREFQHMGQRDGIGETMGRSIVGTEGVGDGVDVPHTGAREGQPAIVRCQRHRLARLEIVSVGAGHRQVVEDETNADLRVLLGRLVR